MSMNIDFHDDSGEYMENRLYRQWTQEGCTNYVRPPALNLINSKAPHVAPILIIKDEGYVMYRTTVTNVERLSDPIASPRTSSSPA